MSFASHYGRGVKSRELVYRETPLASDFWHHSTNALGHHIYSDAEVRYQELSALLLHGDLSHAKFSLNEHFNKDAQRTRMIVPTPVEVNRRATSVPLPVG